MTDEIRQFVLNEIPSGTLTPEHFQLERAPMPVPGDGEVLVKPLYYSLDAANRAWMQGATYRSALEGGMVMAGGSIDLSVSRVENDLLNTGPGYLGGYQVAIGGPIMTSGSVQDVADVYPTVSQLPYISDFL